MKVIVIALFVVGFSSSAFSSVRDDLAQLYPDLDAAQMDARARNVEDSFHFLRTYVPYFYFDLERNRTAVPASIQKLWNESGWCMGDAHPENFGAVLQPSLQARFTINDIDDSGPCPLVLDALRFFTAVKMVEPRAQQAQLEKFYIEGFKGGAHHPPAVLKDLLKNAEHGGKAVSEKYITNDGHHLDMKESGEDYSPLSTRELQSLDKLFDLEFSGYQKGWVLDAEKAFHLQGGSGGLERVLILMDEASNFPRLVELKQIRRPGIFPSAVNPLPLASKRYATSLKLTQGKAFDTYRIVKWQNAEYWMRPKWKGNVGVNLARISSSDQLDLFNEEAFTLGQIHARGAAKAQSYIQQFEQVQLVDWERATHWVSQEMNQAFVELKDYFSSRR